MTNAIKKSKYQKPHKCQTGDPLDECQLKNTETSSERTEYTGYEDMIDHRSYAHNLAVVKIKPEKKFRPDQRDSNP